MTKEQFKRKYPEGKQFSILGTTYTLHYDDSVCKEQDANGIAELFSKKIIIGLEDAFESKNAYENIEDFFKKVIRHELFHAFLFEMGLQKYSNDELLVDALAIKFPQMMELMKNI